MIPQPQMSDFEIEVVKRLQDRCRKRFLVNIPIPVYITYPDIYFPDLKLCVYIDGPPHMKKHRSERDLELREALRKRGYRVLEFKYEEYNEDEVEKVVEGIMQALTEK